MKINRLRIKKFCKVRNHCHYPGKYRGPSQMHFKSLNTLLYPIQIPIVFLNGSNYDYHFIMAELAKGFTREFGGLRQNRKM